MLRIRVGFTGSRWTPTEQQVKWVGEELLSLNKVLKISEFHHGACVGSDEAAHMIALAMKLNIIVHPPIMSKFLAENTIRERKNVQVLRAKYYTDRNQDIVNASDTLLALPSGEESSQPHSGTWMTVRYALKNGVPVKVCYANGETETFPALPKKG